MTHITQSDTTKSRIQYSSCRGVFAKAKYGLGWVRTALIWHYIHSFHNQSHQCKDNWVKRLGKNIYILKFIYFFIIQPCVLFPSYKMWLKNGALLTCTRLCPAVKQVWWPQPGTDSSSSPRGGTWCVSHEEQWQEGWSSTWTTAPSWPWSVRTDATAFRSHALQAKRMCECHRLIFMFP